MVMFEVGCTQSCREFRSVKHEMKDCAPEDQKQECAKYPYRRVVGQLMYCMVHALITIMYALNILSRYGNNPGPTRIEFLKHLLKYCKYAKLDRLKFATHDGPTDMKTKTKFSN